MMLGGSSFFGTHMGSTQGFAFRTATLSTDEKFLVGRCNTMVSLCFSPRQYSRELSVQLPSHHTLVLLGEF